MYQSIPNARVNQLGIAKFFGQIKSSNVPLMEPS